LIDAHCVDDRLSQKKTFFVLAVGTFLQIQLPGGLERICCLFIFCCFKVCDKQEQRQQMQSIFCVWHCCKKEANSPRSTRLVWFVLIMFPQLIFE